MDNLNAEIIAQTYAAPMLELAAEAGNCDKIKAELEAVSDLLTQEQEFVAVLDSPFVAGSEKTALAEKIFAGRIDRLTAGLLDAVIRRKRIRYFQAISTAYNELLDKQNGIRIIDVTLAAAMSDQDRETLQRQLEDAAGTKIKIKYHIDPSILGGIIIEQEGTHIDNSLRRVLADAKSRIKNKMKT